MQGERSTKPGALLHLFTLPPVSWLFLVVGLLISATASWISYRLIEQEEQARLSVRVEQGRAAIERHLRANFEVVRGLQSHFMSSDVDDRRVFRHYYNSLSLEQRYPGLQALTFSRWLTPEQLPEFIRRNRADRSLYPEGFPDFSIKPAGQRDFYCVVDLMEPLDKNRKPFGFDLCSEPERRSMVERARDSGELTASGPINLYISTPAFGFTLALPVYRSEAMLNTVQERRQAFLGVVTGVYRYQEVIAGALGDVFLQDMDVKVNDLAPVGAVQAGGAHQIFGPTPGANKVPASMAVIELGGRLWELSFYPHPGFRSLAGRWLPPLVASIGLLVTFSVFGVLRLLLVLGKRAEERAKLSEQRLATVINSLPDVIWSLGLPEHSVQYLSPTAATLFGHDLTVSSFRSLWRTIVHHDDQPVLANWLEEIVNGGRQELELRIVRNNGEQRWLQLRAHVVLNEKNQPLRIDGIASDITERQLVESQVRKLSMAVEQSPASVVITDICGRIEYVNPQYCKVTGYSSEEVIGKTPRVNSSGKTSPEEYTLLWQTILAGGVWQGELLNRRKNGELFWELEVIAPVFDASGKICNFVAIKEDISEQKRAQTEMQRMNRTLRVLSRCNAVLVRAASEDGLLGEMCDVLVEVGDYQLVWVGQPATDHSIRVVGQRGFDSPALAGAIASVRWDDSLYGQGPAGRAVRERNIVVERQLDGPAEAPWVVVRRETGVTTIASLPLLAGGEILGVLTLFSMNPEAFDQSEIALLTELADDLAYGLANLRSERERQAHVDELRLMRRAIDASSDGIMVADLRQVGNPLVYVNSAYEQITGFSSSESLGRGAQRMPTTTDQHNGSDELANAIAAAHEARVELLCYRQNGRAFWCEAAISPVRDSRGEVSHVVCVLTDITERKDWESQLEYQATHDALTDLPNRLLLTDRMGQAIATARREDGCVALMLLDLDRFKLVNDSLGHEVGDTLLKTVAARLSARIREGDTVARLGGDEFVVIARVHDEHGAATLALMLMQAVAELLQISEQVIYPSCSLGVALFPRDGEELPTLLRNADAAMYRAKTEGSGYPQFYAQDLTVSTGRRLQLESALRQALERGELQLYFQPKVKLSSGMMVGAEVLLRWQHPQLGMISPVEFIPIAEDTGLILAIGSWVLRETCAQIARWQAQELALVPLAVNLSARQFAAPDMTEQIAATLHEAQIDASLLQLELTESTLVHRPEVAAAMLARLRALGIKLALDDFGTGYSSLNYLRRFPINQLKIDQSFIRELVSDPGSATIALSVINLAHSLRMEVVAEGVETEAQLQFLRRHGCDQVQGYLTGRPVPVAEFQNLLLRPERLTSAEDSALPIRTLLLLDDEPNILHALRRVFAHEGYRVLITTSPDEALEMLALHEVGVILADQRMPKMSGTSFFRRVKLSFPDTVRMILSGYTDLDTLAGAINEGAIYKFLTKPWDDEQLREQVRDAFRYYELMQGRGETTSQA